MTVPSSPEDRERGTGWVGSRRGLAELAGGPQKEYRDPRSGLTPPHPCHHRRGVYRLQLGLLSISPWLLLGQQGQKELISLNGNVGMSDKESVPQVGKEGSNRAVPEILIPRSLHKEVHLDLSYTCTEVSVCQPRSGAGDVHLQFPQSRKLLEQAIGLEA